MTNDQILMGRVTRFVNSLRHCTELGISVQSASPNRLVLTLPYHERIAGNPDTGVIHGGAITTLMDTTSGSVIITALDEFELCPTLDLRVDYMGPAEPHKPVHAVATAYRITRNIIFTRCEAYQDDASRPIAHCVASFMRIGAQATPQAFRDMVVKGDVA